MQIITLIAAIMGLVDAGYLSIVKLMNTTPYCTPGLGDCLTVNLSHWAYLLGIPVAYLGFLTYATILFLLVFGKKIKFIASYLDYLMFFISLVGLLFSAYLTYIEAFVLHAWCQWCVISAILMTIIFVTSVIKLARRQQ